jgi:2'-5' RNA ligase
MFLAAELPEQVKRALIPPLEDLEQMGSLVRRNPVELVHLTLHFLGDVERSTVDVLAEELAATAAREAPLAVEAAGVGAFPSAGRPMILWAGIVGEQLSLLSRLHAVLGEVLAAHGFAVEARPYRPHLTLARLRRPPTASQRRSLGAWLSRWAQTGFGGVQVKSLVLFRSQLSAAAPHHTRVRILPLQ